MQLSIYLILPLVALSAAEQFDSGPKVSKETSQYSDSPNSPDKIYSTKEIILYLTPSEIKTLQSAKSAENKESPVENKKDEQQPIQDYNNEQYQNAWSQYYKSLSENKALQAAKSEESKESFIERKKEDQQLSFQNYNDEQQNAWSQYYKSSQAEEPNQEWQNTFYSKEKPVSENQPGSIDSYNLNFEQDTKEQQQNFKDQEERKRQESEWISFNSAAAKKQEEALLQDQLQQHWNRILNHNRAQLRSLSAIGKEQINSESYNEDEINEDIKSDIEKQIEFTLNKASDFEKKSNGDQADRFNQRPPIIIHKEVRITKHHPFPVVEKVKVPVPWPVLVPVPEPYEVKVPHPYPVPVKIVKHIPVPVIRNK